METVRIVILAAFSSAIGGICGAVIGTFLGKTYTNIEYWLKSRKNNSL